MKTHYPERKGTPTPPFQAHRIVLLVRNPYDAFESYFHMAFTNTHTESLTEEVFKSNEFWDIWKDLCVCEMKTYRDFHLFWINQQNKAPQVPVLIIRYEDLITETKEIMRRVLAFTMGKPLTKIRREYNNSNNKDSIQYEQDDDDGIGEFWERRLNHVLGDTQQQNNNNKTSIENLGSYKPRSSTSSSTKPNTHTSTTPNQQKVKIGKSIIVNN